MDHAGLVRGLESGRNLSGEHECFVDRQRPFVDQVVEATSFHQFHHQERAPVDLLEPVDSGDVRMVQRGQHLRLAPQSGEPVGIAGELVGQHLDCHLALERRVLSPVDGPHAIRPEFAEDPVGAERGTDQRGPCPPYAIPTRSAMFRS